MRLARMLRKQEHQAEVCKINLAAVPDLLVHLAKFQTLRCLQAVGPVAITSLILSNGLVDLIPGAEDNDDPNMPYNPEAQYSYNSAAIQVGLLSFGDAIIICIPT